MVAGSGRGLLTPSEMEIILQDKSQYVEVELSPSHHFKSKVLTWADEYLESNDTDDITYKFISDVNPQVMLTDL